MVHRSSSDLSSPARAFARRLLRDTGGNTLAMIAAAVVPLLAIVGGGVDMGRSYLAQTRLQQACDAGVLAARKKLGSEIAVTGTPPAAVKTVGDQFFNQNFRKGAYGSANRSFVMTLEADYAISGKASVDVPTTIMAIFGRKTVAINTECQAKLNFSNTDIMFVLDTTTSMSEKNPSDTAPRIDVMKGVVKSFYSQIEGSKSPGTRVRYGFLPYSTNVRVADILKSDWMVDKWTYQSRTPKMTGSGETNYYTVNYEVISGSITDFTLPNAPSCPANTNNTSYGPTTEVSADPHEYWYTSNTTGEEYWCTPKDGMYVIKGRRFDNYVQKATWKFAYKGTYYDWTYDYKPVEHDVSALKAANGNDAPLYGSIQAQIEGSGSSDTAPKYNIWNSGCIEERDTYEITDYSNVNFSKALDLDIDLVPKAGNPKTQWRPMLPELVFEREINYNNSSGAFNTSPVTSTDYFLNPGWFGIPGCPAAAKKLSEMTASDVDTYLATLYPDGDTYHDIGMIWGARMLSPTGIFASENADLAGKPTSRHLIFLTDGQTETYDVNYGAYGVDGLDQRRWKSKDQSGISLDEVVEKRFGVACEEAKKRNITVWVIGFGTSPNATMIACAGPGHYFEATDANQLSTIFSNIASQLGDLRISK